MSNENTSAKTMSSRIAYSFGAFGHDMFYGMLSTYFMMFVTGHLFSHNSPAEAAKLVSAIGVIIMVLRIVELLIDPYIGNTIDKTNTKWGHFKPWVVGGGIISAVAIMILFTDLGGLTYKNPLLYLIVFAILYITMDIFYSFNDVAFWSMVPAIAFDSEERDKVATFARVGSTVGGQLVGVIVMPIVLYFSLSANGGTGDSRGWFAFAAIVAIIAAVTSVGVGIFTHEKQNELRENKENTSFGQVLGVLFHNDQLMAIALTYLFYTTGVTLLNSLGLYYFTYILGKAAMYTTFAAINGVIGFFTVMFFPALAKKFSRRKVFITSVSIMLLAVIIYAFAGKSVAVATTAGVLFALPQPLVFLVVLMTITDCVEYGQLKLGHRDEGLILSVRPLLDKFGGAVANGVIVVTSAAAGMISGATAASITPHGSLIFKLVMFLVPAILIIISFVLYLKMVKLDEKRHAEIVDELEKTWHKTLDGTDEHPVIETPLDGAVAFMAPVDGQLEPLSDVADHAFASGSLGDGFAIKPTSNEIHAPFAGKIVATFPTNHAVGMVSDNGIPVLIHVGINTVEMQGTGFTSFIEKGQHVEAGDLLLEFSFNAIKRAGKDNTVMVAFTKNAQSPEFELHHLKDTGSVTINDQVLEVK